MIKKLVTSLIIAVAIVSINPIGVSAAWKNDSNGWWYSEGSNFSTGWKEIDGQWYYFDSNGYMKTGWIQDASTWYYLKDNGTMATADLSIQGKKYKFSSDGKWSGTLSTTSSPPSDEKLKATNDCSWFTENGNTYFKTTGIYNAGGVWNIDGKIYYFDDNGVMQKGENILNDGLKYLFGDDGKLIKCISDESLTFYPEYAATTYSSTQNKGVTLDNKIGIEGNELKSTTNKTIFLGPIMPKSVENDGKVIPSLVVKSTSSNSNVAFCGVEVNNIGGTHVIINPTVITKNPGKAIITIDVNGTKTSFNVVVTK